MTENENCGNCSKFNEESGECSEAREYDQDDVYEDILIPKSIEIVVHKTNPNDGSDCPCFREKNKQV